MRRIDSISMQATMADKLDALKLAHMATDNPHYPMSKDYKKAYSLKLDSS